MNDTQHMRPGQARDFTAGLFEQARHMKLVTPAGFVKTVTKTWNPLAVIVGFDDGTRMVLAVTVHPAQDGGQS